MNVTLSHSASFWRTTTSRVTDRPGDASPFALGLLLRRARWLCLLAESTVAFREQSVSSGRCLVFSRAALVESYDLENVADVGRLPVRRHPALRERQASFDAPAYDRVRVLLTELRRVHDEGGDLALRVGAHILAGERLARFIRAI